MNQPADVVCGICRAQVSKYTCPRCNVLYCSSSCYKSTSHSQCSEEFYREWVMSDLRGESRSGTSDGGTGRRAVVEALMAGVEEGDASDTTKTHSAGIDFGTSSDLWDSLTEEERQGFFAMMKDGSLNKAADWTPWWMKCPQRFFVQEIGCQTIAEVDCPPLVSPDAAVIESVKKHTPNSRMLFSVIDILLGYVSVVHRYCGCPEDLIEESVPDLMRLSTSLCRPEVYNSFEEVLARFRWVCRAGQDTEQYRNIELRAVQDTRVILSSQVSPVERSPLVLHCLSHVVSLLKRGLRDLRGRAVHSDIGDDGRQLRRSVHLAARKAEYCLGWTTEYTDHVTAAASELELYQTAMMYEQGQWDSDMETVTQNLERLKPNHRNLVEEL